MTTNESKSYLAYLNKLLDQFSTLKAKVIDLDKKNPDATTSVYTNQ